MFPSIPKILGVHQNNPCFWVVFFIVFRQRQEKKIRTYDILCRSPAGSLGLFATRFARIDSRESFAIETPIFIARHADSQESLEFPIRANHPIRANRANRFARITPLSAGVSPRSAGPILGVHSTPHGPAKVLLAACRRSGPTARSWRSAWHLAWEKGIPFRTTSWRR